MGFFDWDTASVISRKSHRSTHSSKHRSHSRNKSKRHSGHHSHKSSRSASPGARSFAASIFGTGEDSSKRHSRSHNHRSSSFFGLPNSSSRSFFGLGGDKHRSSTSTYRRSPRPSFIHRAYKHLKRLLRDLASYAKRHPYKVLTLVVLPLITGGALTALLARFGLRMPPGLERLIAGAAAMVGAGGAGDAVGLVGEAVRMASGSGGRDVTETRVGRGRDGEMQWERTHYEGPDLGAWGGGVMRTVREFFD